MQSSVLFYILHSYTPRKRRRPEKRKIKAVVDPDKTFIARLENCIEIDCSFCVIQESRLPHTP